MEQMMMSPFVPLVHAVPDAVNSVRARNFRAGRDSVRAAAQGGIRMRVPCGISTRLRLVPNQDEPSAVHGGSFHEGRRPTGLVSDAPLALGSTAGDLFASLSRDAAASVLAYREMARELRAFGAPRGLRDRVRRAASDSIRHTRIADTLCARFEAEPERPMVIAQRDRTLAELAKVNVVEGCIHETWIAALALWQAEHADAPVVRMTMRDLAQDRMRHAQLAWDLHRWMIGHLEEETEISAVDEAARRAVARLVHAPVPILTPATRRSVGIPDSATAKSLVHALFDGLAMETTTVRYAAGS
jgi:hypothetical protein